MRMTQIIGLNQFSMKLIEPKEEALVTIKKVYLDGFIEESTTRELVIRGMTKTAYSSFYGMSISEVYPLYKYTFTDGRVLSDLYKLLPGVVVLVFFLL
jgi:hypothetical protein